METAQPAWGGAAPVRDSTPTFHTATRVRSGVNASTRTARMAWWYSIGALLPARASRVAASFVLVSDTWASAAPEAAMVLTALCTPLESMSRKAWPVCT